MKFSIRALLAVLLLAAVVTAVIVSRYAPITLRIGMDRAEVENLLRRTGAEDLSDGMSYTVIDANADGTTSNSTDADFNPTGMWHLSSINLTVETRFVEGKLAEINVWDWRGRQLDRYHHLLEYDSVSELIVPVMHGSYRCEILQTYNKGVNPPLRKGDLN